MQVDKTFDPVRVSSYDDNIKRWLQYYPLNHFLIIENKDLKLKPLSGKHIIVAHLKKSLMVQKYQERCANSYQFYRPLVFLC